MIWTNPFQLWADSLATGAAMARTGVRFGEMLAASAEVIDSRSRTIADACSDPLGADYGELSRMMPEKLDAFWEAGMAAADDLAAVQSMALASWSEMATLAARGKMPSAAQSRVLVARSSRMANRATAAAAKALIPVHTRATANARRLRGKRAKKP